MSWHYEPIKNKIDWTVSRCVGRFFSPFFWKDTAQCACVCGAIRNIVAVFVGPKATKICSSSLLSPFVLCFFLFWNNRRHIADVLYAWGKVTTFSLPNHNNTEKKKKNFFSSVVKTHLSLKKWRNKKRKWAPSQPFVTTTRELTDLFFFLLWALFRTVAQDLRVLRFPFAYRGIKEETDVRTTMENPVQTKIKRKEEKKMCLGMTWWMTCFTPEIPDKFSLRFDPQMQALFSTHFS